jgi:hypothetical protein
MTVRMAVGTASILWFAAAVSTWVALVPASVSWPQFAWLNGTALSLVAVGRMMWNRTRTGPSVTRTLHDLERRPRTARW